MLGGDENSSRDMAQFVDRCDMLRQRFQCAVIVVHHTNKTGIWERGSNALRGAVEMMLRITDEDELIVIECSKSKNDRGFEPIYRRLTPVDVGLVDEDGNAVMPAVAVLTERMATEDLSGLTRNQRLVLETVCEVFEGGFTIIELNDTLNHIDRGTLYRVVSKLRKLGYIDQPAKRDPYEITPAGFAAVGANVANVANVAVVHKYSDTGESDSENKKYNRDNRHNRDKQHVSTVFGDRNSYYDEGM
jgi:DNA-binding PadR family transcriptional regulator